MFLGMKGFVLFLFFEISQHSDAGLSCNFSVVVIIVASVDFINITLCIQDLL